MIDREMLMETHRIEYKRELTPDLDLEKEVIAFLNSPEGGLIFFGIDSTGARVGVADVDDDMLKIKDRIKNNITPSVMGLFDVLAEEEDGIFCIKVIIASGSEKPYFKKKFGMTEKGCFLRIGTASEPMPTPMIEKLFATRTRNSIGKIKSHRQSLSFEQLRIYYEEKGRRLNPQFKTNLELLTENGDLNYAAYLLADENNLSIKVAKYRGKDRADLTESNEYGYCSLVKATKNVLNKLDIENRTAATITAKERHEQRLWQPIAIREAVINAIVHNDYTREVPPKFEIFSDRLEITSAGALPEGLTQAEFFEGYSIPRNKELMRVFKDLELVEHLGSGIPRIIKYYPANAFHFTENFIRMAFPAIEPVHKDEEENEAKPAQVITPQVVGLESGLESDASPTQSPTQSTDPVNRLLLALEVCPKSAGELRQSLDLKHRPTFRDNYIYPALNAGLIERTIPEKPTSRLQKYRLTQKGRNILSESSNE